MRDGNDAAVMFTNGYSHGFWAGICQLQHMANCILMRVVS